ncbi:MAG: hypothetical protein WBJ85_03650 [Acetomicrobium sp.]|uniref:hypothetical protein n=2 Tax=Acetomicrobium sp. TaxID=1872099 RepID=UPI002BE05333|nr:hypothetical protein [Synergistota bacterium]HOM96740.1 hypothetical protein [Acetomicrobium sp.]HXK98850.1 hypothetical protein [Acetomicrobium sp.]
MPNMLIVPELPGTGRMVLCLKVMAMANLLRGAGELIKFLDFLKKFVVFGVEPGGLLSFRSYLEG